MIAGGAAEGEEARLVLPAAGRIDAARGQHGRGEAFQLGAERAGAYEVVRRREQLAERIAGRDEGRRIQSPVAQQTGERGTGLADAQHERRLGLDVVFGRLVGGNGLRRDGAAAGRHAHLTGKSKKVAGYGSSRSV